MPQEAGPATGALLAAKTEIDRQLVERLRLAAVMVLCTMPFYVLADIVLRPPSLPLLQLYKALLTVVSFVVWWASGRPWITGYTRWLGVGYFCCVALLSAASSNISGQLSSHALLSIMATLYTATLCPWGPYVQILAVVVMAASVLWNVYVVTGSLLVVASYPGLIIALTWLASIYVANLLAHGRNALALKESEHMQVEAAVREEAATSAALVRFAERLIAAVRTPTVLQQIVKLTTELLQCDRALIVMREGEGDVYVIVAHHGFMRHEAETLNVIAIPGQTLQPMLERVMLGELVLVEQASNPEMPAMRLTDQYGMTTRMHAGLRIGEQFIGYLTAAYANRDASFSSRHQRMMRGLAQMVSLALETTRLLEELKRADRFKSDFVANMSHELRTPLNVIIGYQELLLEGMFGAMSAEQRDAVQRTDKSARELLDLVNVTLDLSRLEARPQSAGLHHINLSEFVHELSVEMSTLERSPAVRLEWQVLQPGSVLLSDPTKLRMVLKNLVHNALKFTERGHVTVRVERSDSGVELRVVDSGVGIPSTAQAQIFEPFYQVDASRSAANGAGLGLYIVSRLVEGLGGTISVDSVPGQGASFRVWLPQPGAGNGYLERGDRGKSN